MRPRWIAVAHRLPDRTRLRTPVLRGDVAASDRLADAFAALPGVREVTVRPYTGSVLIVHDEHVELAALLTTAQQALDLPRVLAPGEPPPRDPAVPTFSSVARKLIAAAREIDLDVRRRTEGSIDLGTITALCFAGAGALEVATTGQLPMPPWFNLAWWSFRTFMTLERDELRAEREQGAPPSSS